MADVTEILAKDELLAAIRRERARFDELLSGIEDARMLVVIREDGWTAKDMLVHVTAWEERLLRWIDRWRATGVPQRPEPGIDWGTTDNKGVDVLNQRDHEASIDKDIATVRAESADAYERVVAAVESLSDDELTVPTPAWDGLALSWIVRANTDEHYQEHREEMERWLRDHPA
jgi:hypothetical protein